MVNEETFKQIYAQFFPHGGKQDALSGSLKCDLMQDVIWLQSSWTLCARKVR